MTPMHPDHAFFEQLKTLSERAWARHRTPTLAEQVRRGVSGSFWQRGTRWTCDLDAAALAAVEEREGAPFTEEHRAFLLSLHATTPGQRSFGYGEADRLQEGETLGFYHWVRDVDAIADARAGVVEGLAFDVEHDGLWLPSWGEMPATADGREARVAALVGAAPRLAPLLGHRFTVPGPKGRTVVLSICQSDIIVYGESLAGYLLAELDDLLPERDTAALGDAHGAHEPLQPGDLPFWGELIARNEER